MAVANGHADAGFNLAGYYLTGKDGVIKQSDTEAFLLMRRSAELGSVKAM